jgi:hypothetical protein
MRLSWNSESKYQRKTISIDWIATPRCTHSQFPSPINTKREASKLQHCAHTSAMRYSPAFLPSALPSELLSYIIKYCSHPTTLVICSTRADFLQAISDEASRGPTNDSEDAENAELPQRDKDLSSPARAVEELRQDSLHQHPGRASAALARITAPLPLYQAAVARHIRIVFIPTVSHLRAFLAIFDPADSTTAPPPPEARLGLDDCSSTGRRSRRPPLLLLYGFLELHRDTSEWSAQGLGSTTAALVEAAARHGFRAAVVEVRAVGTSWRSRRTTTRELLEEEMPILHGNAKRLGGNLGWSGRTVQVKRILGRWFRFPEP